MRVLIVEDEPYLAEAVRDGARLEQSPPTSPATATPPWNCSASTPTTSRSSTRDIPGPSGDEVARRIVASGRGIPILMLTAPDRIDDKASGSSSAPTTTSPNRSSCGNSSCG